MNRRLRALCLLVATGWIVSACGQAEERLSMSGPAFEMVVKRQVPCPTDVTATACVKVRIVNRGETAGDGFCQLRLTKIETNGEDVDVWGERFSLTDVPAGAVVERTLPWRHKSDPTNLVGYCEPGLRL